MKEAVMKVMEGYVTAYKNNDKELFLSLWDEAAIFEDPVGAEPCKGIDSISAFWDDGSITSPDNLESLTVNIDDFKDRG